MHVCVTFVLVWIPRLTPTHWMEGIWFDDGDSAWPYYAAEVESSSDAPTQSSSRSSLTLQPRFLASANPGASRPVDPLCHRAARASLPALSKSWQALCRWYPAKLVQDWAAQWQTGAPVPCWLHTYRWSTWLFGWSWVSLECCDASWARSDWVPTIVKLLPFRT